MSATRSFELATPAGTRLHGILDPPEPGVARPAPAVVVCHGFKGFARWGFFPCLAELLAARGFAVVRFDFSGSGMGPDDELVSDLESFRGATFSRDLAELEAVLAALGREIGAGCIDRDRVGLVGHSRGGGTALLAAAAREGPARCPRALVTWAAVATFDRFDDAQKRLWRQRGELPVVNARTGQKLALGLEVLADVERNAERLDLTAAAARRGCPWLIVHGELDATVPVAEAEALRRAAAPPVELRAIAGADHTFGARHPFHHPTPQLIQALNLTQTWLRRHV